MKKLTPVSVFMLAAVFVSLCVFRIWYTFLLITAAAVVITLVSGRKHYCRSLCPAGLLQDLSRGVSRPLPAQPFFFRPFFKWVLSGLYLVYIILYLFFISYQPGVLWQAFFRMMAVSAAAAIALQQLYGPRAWCARLCPLGNLQSGLVRIRAMHQGKGSKISPSA